MSWVYWMVASPSYLEKRQVGLSMCIHINIYLSGCLIYPCMYACMHLYIYIRLASTGDCVAWSTALHASLRNGGSGSLSVFIAISPFLSVSLSIYVCMHPYIYMSWEYWTVVSPSQSAKRRAA